MSNRINETELEEIYELLENAVFRLSANSEMMIDKKARIVEDTFNTLMQKCEIEEVD